MLLPGLHATSVHPGGIATTELVRHMDPSVMASMMTQHTTTHLKSAQQGCATTVWATVGRWAVADFKFCKSPLMQILSAS